MVVCLRTLECDLGFIQLDPRIFQTLGRTSEYNLFYSVIGQLRPLQGMVILQDLVGLGDGPSSVMLETVGWEAHW